MISYRLYRAQSGYGNFEDLRPTNWLRQFARKSDDDLHDYLFGMAIPASANDSRVLITLSKTSTLNPEEHEVAFHFLVPLRKFIEGKKINCHFGYTSLDRNCDVYTDIHSAAEYPFLPSHFQNAPLRCVFRLNGRDFNWERVLTEASAENPFQISLPGSSTSEAARRGLSFRFECRDMYNRVVSANGEFSQNGETDTGDDLFPTH